MSAIATKLPPRTGPNLSAVRDRIVREEQVDRAAEAVRELLAEEAAERAKYAAIVEKVSNDLVGLVEAGQAVDVQDVIDGIWSAEQTIQVELRAFRKDADGLFRSLRHRPDAMPLLNETIATMSAGLEQLAEVHRDARWRLMQARAAFRPSSGKGAIHGSPTDADEYLKSLN